MEARLVVAFNEDRIPPRWQALKLTPGMVCSAMKIGILALVGIVYAQCSRPRVRREIRELSERELREFTDAVNQLHRERKPGMQGMSSFEYFSYLHATNTHLVHATASFLPWHRYFIRRFELELQRINPGVTLPYWDWSLDANEPHNSPVLSSRFMGGNGVRFGKCVRDGPFSGWQMSFPNRHCLRRDYNLGDKLSAFSSPESILLDIGEPRFSDFSLQFEIKHGRPHTAIGGRAGDFSPMHSPNDPLFFLHHAFVDLVWDKWQLRHPSSPYEGGRYRTLVDLDDALVGFDNATVRETLDTETSFYCYTYPSYPRVIAPASAPSRLRASTRTLLAANPFLAQGLQAKNPDAVLKRLVSGRLLSSAVTAAAPYPKLKVPGNLTRVFIRANNFNPAEVDRVQAKERALVERLNRVTGFRSVSSVQAVLNSYN